MAARGTSGSFFDLWSRTYNNPLLQAVMYRPVHDAVMVALAEQRPGCVLDVGCGTGLLTARVRAELGVEVDVVGCDYSSGMLARASSRSPALSFVRGNAMALPIGSATVDAIVCTESFHWYDDQWRAVDEFARVLRPSGRVYVALVNPPLEYLSEWARRFSRRYGQPFHWPTTDRMRSMFVAAGLPVVRQQRVLRPPSLLLFPAVLTIAERPPVE